ncbi:recombinase family protein [Clostridium sp. BNL1100]|uniref:recombinase family protein n=1 Tax=Clostridium sp. BNL1100 TaxID=755731 RepID=UPI00024A7A85|nr:recombinase family protein [Clostridium sp. BNL1100]AEY66589.1 site-specific recombinase, DNA invertase Pin [Clostridium sp. BNL1100]
MNEKLRVATYSRVSTKFESQKTSIINQENYFERLLEKHKNEWELFRNYVDEGITGTSLRKRKEFAQLIEDAKTKKFDILVAKSMTRFGRNRADTSNILVKILFPLGIRVIFVEEKLDSDIREDRQKFGLFEWLAEIESAKISDRINWTIEQQREKGLFTGNRPPYGYTLDNHVLVINKDESNNVETMFNLYTQGYGIQKIVNYLNENDISPKNAVKWSKTTVIQILSNPNYTGSLYQRRTKTKDPISKELIKFEKSDWLITKNTHEAIISEEVFNNVQIEKERRFKLTENNTKYSGINLFSGIIRCGRCKSYYVRKKVHGKYIYSCSEYEKLGVISNCSREAIDEEVLKRAINNMIVSLLDRTYIDKLYSGMLSKIGVPKNDATKKLKNIKSQLEKLYTKQKKLLDSYFGDNIIGLTEIQFIEFNKEIQEEINSLQNEKSTFTSIINDTKKLEEKYISFKEELVSMRDINTWTNSNIREFFPEIIVLDRNTLKVCMGLGKRYNMLFLDGNNRLCL